MGNYSEAIGLLKHVLEVNKGELSAYCDIGVNYSRMGNQDEARKYFTLFQKVATEVWVRDYPDYSGTYTTLAAVAAHLNEMDKSQELLLKAMKLDSTQHFKFAGILCLHGKIHEALDELEQAMEGGYRDLVWIKMNSDFDVLKYDTRLQDLYKKYFR
jgi:tetratricopeptide (TPR) repeat protein